MSNKILEQLPSMDTTELWHIFNMLKEDGAESISDEIYRTVKYGKDIKFNIIYYIKHKEGEIRIMKYHHKSGKIFFVSKLIRMDSFFEEIEYRDAIMRKIIKNEYENKDPTEEE